MLKHPSPIRAVVVGASAGAIEALRVVLPALPANFAAPVFVVVHLPPRKPSLLCEIFSSLCPLSVREASDQASFGAGSVWFAPPDYHMLVESETTLALSIDAPEHYSRPSIDVLFESAAQVFGPSLLAVVLTGANEDGARGAQCVRENGGLVAVQSPESAQMPLMPEAAIARAQPQFTGSLSELTAFIVSTVAGSTT
ncbi:MAG: chemotaxis protein CheB [Myxococcales bacterium]